MKKLYELSHRVIGGAVLPSLAIALGIAFWSATTTIAKGEILQEEMEPNKPGKSKPGKSGPGGGKCDVCHNPHNYHTISIPCDQVDKFLERHPGDFRGRCEATPVTNA